MWRLLLLCLSCSTGLTTGVSRTRDAMPPWVSCFKDTPDGEWLGSKTVRTPTVVSMDGRLRAYAVIEARTERPRQCLNTVRLFVSTQRPGSFQQVYAETGSDVRGTANSLRPVGWSPDGRWLLVGFGNWWYESDAGGLSILLYDILKRSVIVPDVGLLVTKALKKECSIHIGMPFRFDSLSRVHLRLSDDADEGETEPATHCFQGQEEWVYDPRKDTMRLDRVR